MDKEIYRKRQMQTPYSRTCTNDECETKAIVDFRENLQKTKIKEAKKETEELRKKWGVPKKVKGHKERLQELINKIVRILDEGKPCTARPNLRGTEAGHVYSIGAHENLRYNLWNIHIQSNYSNQTKGGERGLMLIGIERRYGKEKREYVESFITRYQHVKVSDINCSEKRKIANEIIKELGSGIIMSRDEINERLGIYI